MEQEDECPICKTKLAQPSLPIGGRDALFVDCPHCGPFNLSRTALVTMQSDQSHYPENVPYIPEAKQTD